MSNVFVGHFGWFIWRFFGTLFKLVVFNIFHDPWIFGNFDGTTTEQLSCARKTANLVSYQPSRFCGFFLSWIQMAKRCKNHLVSRSAISLIHTGDYTNFSWPQKKQASTWAASVLVHLYPQKNSSTKYQAPKNSRQNWTETSFDLVLLFVPFNRGQLQPSKNTNVTNDSAKTSESEVEYSRSYPGLKTVYNIHTVKCRVKAPIRRFVGGFCGWIMMCCQPKMGLAHSISPQRLLQGLL